MKQRGVWVTLTTVLLLLLGLSGDSTFSCFDRYQHSGFVAAGLELNSNLETIEVEPGRIAMERTLQQPQSSVLSNSSSMLSNESNVLAGTLEVDMTGLDGNMDEPLLLTLLTFNIRSANDKNGSMKLEEIIKEIRETDAHIIGLQEVERMMPRSGYRDQARLIAEELGYHYYYGENINIFGVQYGNALLSKYPILEADNHKLPKEKLEPRGMIEADIDINGVILHVYATHLGLNALERNKQVHYINGILSQREGNILLLGNFNNRPGSEEMSILDDRMTDSAAVLNRLDQYTFAWKSTTPNVRLDRIYTSDNIKLQHHEVQPSAVSDHKRVLTQIQVNILPEEGIQQEVTNRDR
jgi:endonuclease/exonuclease/phosphatase family metal-dependent hydrolase